MSQNIEWNFEDDLTALNAGRRFETINPVGIFFGMNLSIETNSSARISSGVLVIEDYRSSVDHQIRMSIPDHEIVSDVTPSTPWIIGRWEFTTNSNNTVQLTTTNNQPSNSNIIIFGKGTFDGNGDLDGFDLTERSDFNYMNRHEYDSNNDGLVDNADRVDGFHASTNSTYDTAGSQELLPKVLIDQKIDTAAQGIEGAAATVDDLPTISTANDELEPGDLYVVEEGQNTTTHSNVQGTGGTEEYPAGLWEIVDTDSDGSLDEWQFLTDMGEIGQAGMKAVDVFVANEGDTTFTPSEPIESDGTNSMVIANNMVAVIDRDYSISNGDVVFDIPRDDGEVIVIFIWKAFGTTSQVVAHASQHAPGGSDELDITDFHFDEEGTLPAGSDTITLSQNAQSKDGMSLNLGGVAQPPSAFVFNAPNEIVVDETFDSDIKWHVEAIKEL